MRLTDGSGSPAPGATGQATPYSATPTPTPSPSGTPQSVNGNVNAFAAGAGAAAGAGNVFMGNATQTGGVYSGGQGYGIYGIQDPNMLVPIVGQRIGAAGPVYLNLQQAANQYYQWSPDQQNTFRAKMSLIDSTYQTATDAQLAQAWGNLVNQSAAYAQAGVGNVSPWDVLAKDIASNNGGKGRAGKDFTRTISTVQTTSAADANALFTAAAQSLLGRAPTADELSAFRNNLHGLEQANPTTQTIQYSFLPGQSFYPDKNVTKTSGGVSQAAMQNLALEQAKTNPEYGAYQAATTYFGALQELLSGGKV